MKRKMVSCVLVVAFVFYAGCYSTDIVTKEELTAEQEDIAVYTKGSWRYEFSKGNFHFQGDSLSGAGVRMIKNTVTKERFDGSLAFADITLVQTEEFNTARTILLVGGAGLVVVLIIGIATSGSGSFGDLKGLDFGK